MKQRKKRRVLSRVRVKRENIKKNKQTEGKENHTTLKKKKKKKKKK